MVAPWPCLRHGLGGCVPPPAPADRFGRPSPRRALRRSWPACSAPTYPSPSGPTTAAASGPIPPRPRIVVRSPDALRRIVTAPGELGLSRGPTCAGELDVEGDIFAVLELRAPPRRARRSAGARCSSCCGVVGLDGLRAAAAAARGGAPARPAATRSARDAAAIAHHYDVANDFYELVLGPSMTYSCARCGRPPTLDARGGAGGQARAGVPQARRSSPGMRLLDVGCGWGGMVMPRRRAPRRARGRRHALEPSRPSWARERGRATPGSPTGSRSGCRTTATSRRPVRRDQLDRHVRARRPGPARRVLRHAAPAAAPRGPAAEPRHQPTRRASGAAASARARLHRPLRVPRRRAARGRHGRVAPCSSAGLRGPRTSRACASTTRSRCGRGSPTSRRTGTRRSRWSARRGPGCGGSTWPASAVDFEDGRIQVHQVLGGEGPTAVASGFDLRPDWDAAPLDVVADPTGGRVIVLP